MRLSRREFACRAAALMSSGLVGSQAWPGVEAPPIRFVEGSAAAGIDFRVRSGAVGNKTQPESMGGGLGVIDFDGDGWPDLFCVNGATIPPMEKTDATYWNRLYKNNRDGTFTDVTVKAGLAGHGYGIGVAVGDFDNDGHEDLFVVGVHENHLYRNNGDGTFSDITQAAGLARPQDKGLWAIAAAWIDYDGDGRLDLFISNCCDWAPGLDPICGGMTPETRVYCHPDRYRAERMQLFHNNGDGTFTDVTGKGPLPVALGKGMGVAVADFAGDGRPGIFVANDNARNLLFRNTGHGFEEIGLDAGVAYNGDGRMISGMGADFGDIDGDGRFDIVMTALKNESFGVFMNRGDGKFEDGNVETGLLKLILPVSGWGCGLVDLDNDGWLDFFVAASGVDFTETMPNFVFRNLGGRFTNASEESGVGLGPARMHRGVVFADLTRDGRLDAVVTSLEAPLELWWNRSPQQHWLQMRLTGTHSNRSAIGALVTCKSSTRTQIRTVTSSVGYASSGDLTVHFGLGKDRVANIEVRWPSGIVQNLGSVAADQRIEVKEHA